MKKEYKCKTVNLRIDEELLNYVENMGISTRSEGIRYLMKKGIDMLRMQNEIISNIKI